MIYLLLVLLVFNLYITYRLWNKITELKDKAYRARKDIGIISEDFMNKEESEAVRKKMVEFNTRLGTAERHFEIVRGQSG